MDKLIEKALNEDANTNEGLNDKEDRKKILECMRHDFKEKDFINWVRKGLFGNVDNVRYAYEAIGKEYNSHMCQGPVCCPNGPIKLPEWYKIKYAAFLKEDKSNVT